MRIEVDGLKEFQRATRRAVDKDLPKRIGQAHKEIGELVISRLSPRPVAAAVGEGTGAPVRPSATKREVLLRVGGKHRETASERTTRMMLWGKKYVRHRGRRPKRPHILGTVEANRRQIEDAYFDAIERAMAGDGPFLT